MFALVINEKEFLIIRGCRNNFNTAIYGKIKRELRDAYKESQNEKVSIFNRMSYREWLNFYYDSPDEDKVINELIKLKLFQL